MKLSSETIQIQKKVADYCKSGIKQDIPGVTPNRIHHYRRLISNVIWETLEDSYPITHRILPKEEWKILVDEFFEKATIKTPQIWKMPFEFYQFIRDHNYAERFNKPYLNDLLLLEWTEIEVYTMEDSCVEYFELDGNWNENIIVFNPEYRLINLEYPVHMHKEDDFETFKGKYIVLVFRNLDTKRVHFVNLGLFPALVLEFIENALTLDDAIKTASKTLQIDYSVSFKSKVIEIFQDLRHKGFILGFKK